MRKALDPDQGWLTKSETLEMIRRNFPNLVDYSDDEVLDILVKTGIPVDHDEFGRSAYAFTSSKKWIQLLRKKPPKKKPH